LPDVLFTPYSNPNCTVPKTILLAFINKQSFK
jgi:hypothetical protein